MFNQPREIEKVRINPYVYNPNKKPQSSIAAASNPEVEEETSVRSVNVSASLKTTITLHDYSAPKVV